MAGDAENQAIDSKQIIFMARLLLPNRQDKTKPASDKCEEKVMNPKFASSSLKLAAAAAGVFALAAIAAPRAEAALAFNFNLQNAATAPAMTGVQNVTLITLGGGFSTVIDTLNGSGTVAGTNFVETGFIGLQSYQTGTNSTGFFNGVNIPGTYALYFQYSVTGSVNNAGQLSFSTGTANLVLSDSLTGANPSAYPVVPPGTLQTIETFDLLPGTAGVVGLNNGGIPAGTVSLNFKIQFPEVTSNLFTVFGSNAPLDQIAIQLTNIQPSLNTGIQPNPVCIDPSNTLSPVAPTNGVCPAGYTEENLYFTEQGQLVLAVPEPASLFLFGTGLLGLGFIALRRRNRGTV